LTHPALLVQAWKKTHSYLRCKSWFADILELDLSAVDLKDYIDVLRQDICDGPEHFTPSPMRLVPAPKSDLHPWVFERGAWQPGPKTKKFVRPLAHLALRDQVLATAVMICLADCVETIQGDSDLPTADARKAGVTSYGNRLLVDWVSGDATPQSGHFTWGNAALYRKYYLDYQAFLKRPIDICRQQLSLTPEDAELGVVTLDLRGFYDAIPVDEAIAALKNLSKEAGHRNDLRFWQAVKSCFAWTWDKSDAQFETLLKGKQLPSGLPQGLVAAGFFSNAYMVEFDRRLARTIKRAKPDIGKGWRVLDYCRYVDDIRLVVAGPIASDGEDIPRLCGDWINKQLTKHLKGQQCNDGKSAFASHEEVESRTMRPVLMAAIQDKLSGPIDLQSLEEAGLALDGLLNTVGNSEAVGDAAESKPQDGQNDTTLALERIHAPRHSVRDDTVARFAAFRQLKALRARRFLLAAEPAGVRSTALRRLDAEVESSARRMVWMWSRDPSLVIVLRHAMNLCPTPELIEPVLEALRSVIGPDGLKKQAGKEAAFDQAVAWYTAGELFKAGVIETGFEASPSELPDKADLDGYRESLADFAEELLREAWTPWYVARQAVVFLLSVGRIPLPSTALREKLGNDYLALLKVAKGGISLAADGSRLLPLLLVLDQLCDRRSKTLTRLRKYFLSLTPEVAPHEVERLVLANLQIAFELRAHLIAKRSSKRKYVPLIATLPNDDERDKHETADLGKNATLGEVMGARDNPFVQETAALQLLKKLAEALRVGEFHQEQLQPQSLRLSIEASWRTLKNPRRKQTLGVRQTDSKHADPRYVNPTWANGERGELYALGRLLRAAVLGSNDFTASSFELSQYRDGYSGLKSSWFKRQHGLSTDLSASEWDTTSRSPWFASLVAHLLSWPGSRVDPDGEFTQLRTVDGLLKVVSSRLTVLKKLFGRATDLPVYDCDLRLELKSPPTLSMALVQTVRPTRDDFIAHGADLGSSAFRPVHRGHLATMLRLTYEHLALRPSYDKKPVVDFVVLPELSVHVDDLDLVERFIDATQAIVFCGLSLFHDARRGGLVNSGLWLIPERRKSGRSFRRLLQGKHHLTEEETKLGVLPHRPHQHVLKVRGLANQKPFAISAAICFDATDLSLAADLRDQTDMLIVAANNKDVPTFDTMATALSWHMFQHVAIVNSGEFGGSVVSAPYKERHQRVLKHDHGGLQAAISIVEIDLSDYQRMRERPPRKLKTPPAGFTRH
jgi:hypothetical protein